MKRLFLSSLALAMLAIGANAPAAQLDARDLLTDAQVAVLPPSAREQYNVALQAMNFIRYQDAADALIEAARRAPHSVELNLLAAEAAGRWAEISYGEDSRRYYRAGIGLLETIQNEDMGGTNRGRLNDQLSRQREALGAVGSRDDERMASGFRLVQTVRRERLERAVRDSDEGAKVLLGRDRKAEELGDEDYEKRAGEIWPQLAAPARYVPPRFNPNQFGGQFGPGFGGGQFGFDPAMGGFADPMMYGGGEFGGGGYGYGAPGGGDPFAAGGDPFAAGGDPFGGGGGFGGDPFGGGGAYNQGAGGQNPFIDQSSGMK